MYSYSALSSLRCFVYFNLKRKMSFFLADEASLRFSSQYLREQDVRILLDRLQMEAKGIKVSLEKSACFRRAK